MHVAFVCRLGQDPETSVTKSGKSLRQMRVVVDEFVNGEKKPLWFRVKDFTPDRGIYNTLKKGCQVFVTGDMAYPGVYQRKDGSYDIDLAVFAHSISFVNSGRPEQSSEEASTQTTVNQPVNVEPEPIPMGKFTRPVSQEEPEVIPAKEEFVDSTELPF